MVMHREMISKIVGKRVAFTANRPACVSFEKKVQNDKNLVDGNFFLPQMHITS